MIYSLLALIDIVSALLIFFTCDPGRCDYDSMVDVGFIGCLLIVNAVAILAQHEFKDAITFYIKRKGLEQKKKALQAQKELEDLQNS